MQITNTRVYGLAESIFASGYPMRTNRPSENEFETNTTAIDEAIGVEWGNIHIERAVKLAQSDTGTGHDNFMNGIIVQFDLPLTKSWSPEVQRYHFLDFVSSMSLVHCATKLDFADIANTSLAPGTLENVNYLVQKYKDKLISLDELVDNIPPCFELTARMTTNYRQLKTIYKQRRHHPIKKWQEFCDWIETLPLAKELICYKGEK